MRQNPSNSWISAVVAVDLISAVRKINLSGDLLMKKHLIAAAVAAAVAGPVMAQNVTIYGAIDASIRSHNTGAGVSETSLTGGSMRTNRIGFRGTEDLGGGLKAEFQLQGQFDPAARTVGSQATTGGTTTTNTTGNSLNFGEELWVGLSGGFGHIRAGRTDVSGLQALDSTTAGGVSFFDYTSSVGFEIGNNQSQVLRYISPNVNGFTVDAAIQLGAEKSATTANSADKTTSFLVSYVSGPLSLYGGQASTSAATGGDLADKDYQAIAARYDFGVVNVGIQYSRADISATTNSRDEKTTMVTVAAPLGNGVTLRGAYLQAENLSTDKSDGFSLVLQKDLSKRTTLYAQYTRMENETTGNREWAGTVKGGADKDPSAFLFGVSHAF